ncbi:MAG: glycoside hydrolase family 13 protein [Ruminiclostridium sp.]|nr:glycoside hydrolase family 13 protein [Ruminiclostridium sp.]
MEPIYDSYREEYKKPFGAVRRKRDCEFRLRFPETTMIDEVTLICFRPGQKEHFQHMELIEKKDGANIFGCTYAPEDLGLHYYYFSLLIDHNRHYIKRSGASEGVVDNGALFQLTVYDEKMTTPDWLKGGIMYQIFPDRFAKSGIFREYVPADRQIHTDWDETPLWKPDHRGQITNSDFFGGDLKGIEQKLGYLSELGVTVLYLNPIFEAHENHRYCTANYEKIDPLLGTEADFVSLCKTAKEYGIRIILDGVFSHTGADSIYFNKFGRYGDHSGAYRDPESPYREWYSFSQYPDVYESWWGITTLPNVIETNPSYLQYICGEGGILQKWIDLGASGWRLDVADELPDEFIDRLNLAVKAKGEDKVIYGEVWEDATNKESYGVQRRYLIGGQLDSVMNYPFKEAILEYVKKGETQTLVEGVMTIVEHYPKPCTDILMNFLSTHDTERAITRLAGDDAGWNGRDWQAEHCLSDQQFVFGISLMRCAMVLQYFLPGIPCVYYADEAAQEGYKDPFNRRTYPWGHEDERLIEFVKELGKLRRSMKMLAKGELRFLDVTSEYAIFSRTDKALGEEAVILLNRSRKTLTRSISSLTPHTAEILRGTAGKDGVIKIAPFDFGIVTARFPAEKTDSSPAFFGQAQEAASFEKMPENREEENSPDHDSTQERNSYV